MITIASPTPRHASPARKPPLERSVLLQSPPIYLSSDVPRSPVLMSPPRLMSPINLTPGTTDKSKLSKTSASCGSTKRRRTHTTGSRTTRRRHCARSNCVVTYPNSLHAFDQLPWISQIDSEPSEAENVWDIADLSLIPDHPSLSSIGPVRNRRTSSTSCSVPASLGGTVAREAQIVGATRSTLASRPLAFPFDLSRAADSAALEPRTPQGVTFNPYEVAFHNLMPAFPPVRNECRTPSRPGSRANDSNSLSASPL